MSTFLLCGLLVVLCVGTREEEGTCEAGDSGCGNTPGLAHDRGSIKWQKYLTLITDALQKYQECNEEDYFVSGCGCLKSALVADLSVWKERGAITLQDFEAAQSRAAAAVHYQIINHTLLRQPRCNFPTRCEGVEHFLLELVHDLPDMELLINVLDYPLSMKRGDPLPVFSFSKTPFYFDIMFPAWSFWSGGPAIATDPRGIGRWDLRRETLAAASKQWKWENKKDIGFFRGSRTSSERDPLITLSRRHSELADAQYTKNQAWRSKEDTLGADPAEVVTMEYHCQYKYLFNFRGVAASFRLRHLFLCGSAVLHVGNEWVEFFYPSLRPWVHYVPLDTDLHNVEEVLNFLRVHDDVAKAIALRGYQHIWEHLDMEDVTCYWRALLLGYSQLTTWTVHKQDSFVVVQRTVRS